MDSLSDIAYSSSNNINFNEEKDLIKLEIEESNSISSILNLRVHDSTHFESTFHKKVCVAI